MPYRDILEWSIYFELLNKEQKDHEKRLRLQNQNEEMKNKLRKHNA